MIESLITSRTRIKLLLKFFLNSEAKDYLRGLEQEFGESTNAIRLELNRFEKAGLLESSIEGNKKVYHANTNHPLFSDINSILRKKVGIDQIIERVTSQIGDLQAAYLTGSLARGTDSKVIDLTLVGNNLDRDLISRLVGKAEGLINRKIRYLIVSDGEMKDFSGEVPALLIWKAIGKEVD